MKSRQGKKASLIFLISAIVTYTLIVGVSVFLLDFDRKAEADRKANQIMQSYEFMREKTRFVSAVVAETKWVQNFSFWDADGFAAVDFLDLFEAQTGVRNFNALIGFSCETLIMFDRGAYAVTGTGKIPYAELEYYFDGDAQGFTIYSQKENTYGGVDYVKAGNVMPSVVYASPNKLNAYNVRCVFVLSEDYLRSYFDESADSGYASVMYHGRAILSGAKYRERGARKVENEGFVFGYYQRFPFAKLAVVILIESFVFAILFLYVNFKINDYYGNMQRHIKKLNELAGGNHSDADVPGGIAKQFEEILSEISQAELESKAALSGDFRGLVEEYLRTIAHAGGKINSDVINGLVRLGVDVNQTIAVAYTGRAVTRTDRSIIDLGDAALFLNAAVTEIECVYGQSNAYSGLSYVTTAYEEGKLSYRLAVLYGKKRVVYHEIGVLAPLPPEAKALEETLSKDIMALNAEGISTKLKALKSALAKHFSDPEVIEAFFGAVGAQLERIEGEQHGEIDGCADPGADIITKIDRIEARVARIIAGISQKSGDRYGYYYTIVKNYIDRHFCEPELSLGSIAEEFNYSVAYISRIFSECGDAGYSDYVNGLRVEKAKRLLTQTDLSINAIAEQCGILSPVTFRRVFKKYTDRLPGDYRLNP